MPAIFLYLIISIALIALWRRYVQPMRAAYALALVLLPFCFTGRALLTGRVYGPIDLPYMSEPLKDYRAEHGLTGVYNGTLSDLYMQMIPWQSAVRQSLADGNWPLWNRHMLCGTVLAANMQSAPYDLLQTLGMILPQRQSLTFVAAMTFFLAGLFTFAFARALGMGETAALIAAVAYMFSAIVAFFVGWPLGRSWALAPLIFLGVRLVVRETNLRAAVLLTTGFVVVIFAGHPESVLHIVATGALYGIFELAITRKYKAIVLAVLSGVLALMLTAIALLPFLAAAPQTMEYLVRQEFYRKQPVPSTAESVQRRAALSLFAWYGGQPERNNHTELWEPTNVRVGSVVLTLALAALALAPRRRETWFFFGLAVLGTWAALNAWPVAQVLHALPLFDITINDRLGFAAAFAMAMLAGIAADAWPADRRRALIAAGIVLAGGIALGVATTALRGTSLAAGVKPELLLLLTLTTFVPLAIVALLLALRTPARIALPVVLGVLLLQRTIEDGTIYPALPNSVFYPKTPILEFLQKDTSGPFRMGAMHFMFLPDAAALYGLEDVRGYEAMTFLRLAQTYAFWSVHVAASYNNLPDKKPPFLSLLNMKYLIALPNEQPDDQWKLVFEDRNARILENTRVLPRAFVPRNVRYEQAQDQVLFALSKAQDFAEKAWITAEEYKPHDITNGPGTLTIRRDGSSAYDIDASMENQGWVVVSESAWPGWRAYVDGHRVETKFANHAFLGVYVPAGRHHLRVVYEPESFKRGRNVTLLTIAGLIAFFAFRRYRRGRDMRSIGALTGR
jgi:hypothetical protein